MRKLIKADLWRILRKKSFWITLAVILTYAAGTIWWQTENVWSGFAFMGNILDWAPAVITLFLGMVLFMSVYGDEMKAMTAITVIGRGLPRHRLILAKFIDIMILGAIFIALFCGGIAVISVVSGAEMTGYQTLALYLGIIRLWYTLLMQLAIAGMVFFITSSSSLGVFAFIFLDMILPLVIIMIKLIPGYGEYITADRYIISGVSARVYTSLLLGFPFDAFLAFLAGSTVYILIPLALSAVFYEKKEMDF